jgi:hypothetical protein
MAAAPSMAAALAASLPAPAAVSAPPQPIYESIPPSMAMVVDIEAEIPLTLVQLDGMVCPLLFVSLLGSLILSIGCDKNHKACPRVIIHNGSWVIVRTRFGRGT